MVYGFGDWEVDLVRRELRTSGIPVPVGNRAFEIFEVLVQAGGALVTKDDLMERIWSGVYVEENTLRVHISAVRKALGQQRDILQTEAGRGYRLLGDWTARQDGAPQAKPIEPAPILPPATPPARSNLPMAASDLIGRTIAAQHLRDLVSAYRVVTLTGPGGIGKTVLALEIARGLLPDFEGDAWMVELASLSDPDLVPSAVAGVFGLKLGADAIDPETVARAIGGRRLLLVLDSCEHVIDAAADLAEAIIRMCPHVSILTTSREILRIAGEYVYRVPPLDVPMPEQNNPDDMLGNSAVQLFIARTVALHAGFTPRPEDLPAIAAICRRLDGIPLAIEFAAARAAALGPRQVAARLDDRFGFLTGGRRTALQRHQTLRAVLDWSYDLLPEAERRVLRHLSVFPAGFTLDAAASVAGGPGQAVEGIADDIANLVSKSLVALDGSAPDSRWRLLDTTRAYALEKLAEQGEAEAATRRHARFFRDLLAIGATALQSQPTAEAVARFEWEIDNIRSALDWAFSGAGDSTIGAELTAAYTPVWLQLSLLGECRVRAEMALEVIDHDPASDPRVEMILRAALGTSLAYTRGPVEETESTWQRVRELAAGLGDVEYQLRALYGLWLYRILVCDYRAAETLAWQFHTVAAAGHAEANIPTADRLMAMALHYLGDQEGSCAFAERSLAGPIPRNRQVYTTHYGADQRVGAQIQLARALWLLGLPDQAMKAAQASVEEAAKVGHANSMCLALADGASIVAILTGDQAAAERYATMLADYAGRHGLGVWRTYAIALHGRLLMPDGAPANGAERLRSALADLRDTPFDIRFQLYLVWLTEVLPAAEDTGEALTAIDEAIRRAERTEERWYMPELLRLRGDLLLRRGTSGAMAEANASFTQSLDWARSQGALSWELRTTMSVVRARRPDADRAALHASLSAVLARFQEGFQTGDLVAAARLLKELDD
jgi:predicted ATPase/DNA-binding winged helix-turn-helix (wHTH) protein